MTERLSFVALMGGSGALCAAPEGLGGTMLFGALCGAVALVVSTGEEL